MRRPASATCSSPLRLPRNAMVAVYQRWNFAWSALSRPSMSTMTLIGKCVANCPTRSAWPSCRNPVFTTD
ncbi:hypothetical protein K7G98_35990, partial [Saccharothrix sp. MB29]|nr:hypothetical protein [Saccharothrix sp. MB29]